RRRQEGRQLANRRVVERDRARQLESRAPRKSVAELHRPERVEVELVQRLVVGEVARPECEDASDLGPDDLPDRPFPLLPVRRSAPSPPSSVARSTGLGGSITAGSDCTARPPSRTAGSIQYRSRFHAYVGRPTRRPPAGNTPPQSIFAPLANRHPSAKRTLWA